MMYQAGSMREDAGQVLLLLQEEGYAGLPGEKPRVVQVIPELR